MSKTTDKARVECAFCGVEHMQGNCLCFSTEEFDKWIQRHGMLPNITFYKDTREVDDE